MKNKWIIFCVSFFLMLPVWAATVDLYPFPQEQDRQRFQKITQETRCVVCQNQNLADSDAPLARDLRHKIYEMILDKKSDGDIRQFLVSRYGEFILFSPPLQGRTLLLWSCPLFLLALGLGAFFWRRR